MRFSLFVHMERTAADQDQRRLYDEFIALAKMADDAGMHAVWTGEHHGMDFTISPNPFLKRDVWSWASPAAPTAMNTSVWCRAWTPGMRASGCGN